jgi:hypothetical protein
LLANLACIKQTLALNCKPLNGTYFLTKPIVMNFLKAFPLFVLMLFSSTLMAQQNTVTDDELMKYAVAMDSIDNMTKSLLATITEMVKSSDQVTAARYNELSKIIKDESKLAEANATPEEIAAVKEIVNKKEEETIKINETFQALAKEYVGAAVYNKVKKALASDAELKSKYQAILADLNKEDTD